jgi:type III pantothenate kinase
MLLAIDVGNTHSKFALLDGDRIVARFRLQTQANRPADEYAASLTQLMSLRGIGPEHIDSAIMSTVVPAVTFNIRNLCEQYFGVELLVVGEPSVDLGIKVLLDRPQEAGADRLVGGIAGFRKYGGPLIVIDFGSATTFDIVDADGNFYGGVLAPGIELTIEAFYLMTARLPRIRVDKPATVIGKGTVPAMQSGIFWGYLGLIESLVKRIKAEYGAPMRVIATGGLAPVFQAETDVIEAVEQDLMMDGLLAIYRRNRPS